VNEKTYGKIEVVSYDKTGDFEKEVLNNPSPNENPP